VQRLTVWCMTQKILYRGWKEIKSAMPLLDDGEKEKEV